MLLEYPSDVKYKDQVLLGVRGASWSPHKSTLKLILMSGDTVPVSVAASGTNLCSSYSCNCSSLRSSVCKHIKAIYTLNLDGDVFPINREFWEVRIGDNTARVQIQVGGKAVGIIDGSDVHTIGYLSKGDGIGIVSRMVHNWFTALAQGARRQGLNLKTCEGAMHGGVAWQRAADKLRVPAFDDNWELYFTDKCKCCRLLENFDDSIPVIS